MDQRAEGYAGGAFGEPRFCIVVPGCAGDIQVNPGRVAGKFLQEHRAGDSAAALATADILNVGERALDEFTIFVVSGELPHFLAGGFGACEKLVGPSLIGTKHADVNVCQSDDNSACERSGVNKMG